QLCELVRGYKTSDETLATAVRDHLPGPRPPGTSKAAAAAAARLERLLDHAQGRATRPPRGADLPPGAAGACPAHTRDGGETQHGPPGAPQDGLRSMLAVAAVSTTVAALPRAVARCADAGLWDAAADDALRPVLVAELLRVTAPSPVLPRVAAADATVAGCPVRAGDRLVLVARHAVGAHRDEPDPYRPAPPGVAQLVFGAGPHACPGARLARAQLDDLLAALAPHRPRVAAARVDRRAALPGWRLLTVRADGARGEGR
ncbi:cytochrome P450, partial [Streptomyces sp. CC53]|uniref:cytochrome P450 n=1 Tax=Streptomyces sp. CC53 TaxID=1906740 RepID=UPI00115FA7BD